MKQSKTYINLAFINITILRIWFIFVMQLSSLLSFAQDFNWVKKAGSDSKHWGKSADIITDGTNSYLIGSFSQMLYMDTDSLDSKGWGDMFIAKYDSAGSILWVKKWGGDNLQNLSERLFGVYSDECQCIYLAGVFSGSFSMSEEIELEQAAFDNIFIAKMNLDGYIHWARRIDTISRFMSSDYNNRSVSIYEHSSSGFYIVGFVLDSTYIMNEPVNKGQFIAHFDNSGNLISLVKDILPDGRYTNTKVCHVDLDTMIVYGYFDNLFYIVGDTTLELNGKRNFYISKFNHSGDLLNIRKYGSMGSSDIRSLVIDSNRHMYITGSFQDSLHFGSESIYTSGTDIYIAKLDCNYDPLWIRQMHVTGEDFNRGTTLNIAPDGDIYLSGNFSGQAWFDDYYVTTDKLSDWFISKFSSNGNCKGVIHSGHGFNSSHCMDDGGRVLFNGYFEGTIVMGDTVLNSINNATEMYIASIDSNFTYSEAFRTRNNELVIITNPNKGDCRIMLPDELRSAPGLHLRISNSMGQVILDEKYDSNRNNIHVNIQSEASGVYHASLSSGNLVYHGKIMFE